MMQPAYLLVQLALQSAAALRNQLIKLLRWLYYTHCCKHLNSLLQKNIGKLMTTQKNTEKVVLITGASSGIGEATARLIAQKGLRVVLGARRADHLKAIVSQIRDRGGSAEYCALDVTSLEAMQSFVSLVLHFSFTSQLQRLLHQSIRDSEV
jgi:hypothetical protein